MTLGSQNDCSEEFCVLGYNVVQSVESELIFQRPASCWFLAWHIFLTLKMEAACSSETSADFQQTACCYITEDRTLFYCCFSFSFSSALEETIGHDHF
jgi:hypothetical protein